MLCFAAPERFETHKNVKKNHAKPEFAFTSQEFISKFQPDTNQQSPKSDSQSSEEEEDLPGHMDAVSLSDKDKTQTPENRKSC